ncbi:MAG: DNA helicase [Methylotenera sp.]|nr:DNA helicase [Methylotenera sp.]
MILNSLILCPSSRLARSIQADFSAQQIQAGLQQWISPNVQTLTQWLDDLITTGLLAGQIVEVNPPTALSAFNEQLLWEEVITQSLKKNAFGALFDVAGLALSAMEAHQYKVAWNLHLPRDLLAEESRQFLQWEQAFIARCTALNVLERVRYVDWQLSHLADCVAALPARIAFAGFDQTAPQEQRLREMLMAYGVEVSHYVIANAQAASAQHVSLQNQEAECRAAVAWAKGMLDQNPHLKLAIVVPQLNEVRNQLADLLDDVFYPVSVRPSMFDVPRHYNFSLGTPLAQQSMVQAALNLLRLMSRYALQQGDVSHLLLSPFWSASEQEADARARLDAKIRAHLPMQFNFETLLTFIQKQYEDGLAIARLVADLQAAKKLISPKKAMPSVWVAYFNSLLAALHWQGERSLSSLEFQANNAWQKALQQLADMDVLNQPIMHQEAVSLLQKICINRVFQAETEDEPSLQILGVMEALSAPVDALWCMHMNDHIWPLPASPNPLLPAFIQRAAKLPNADNAVQATFAAGIHQRLLHSAKAITFSSSLTAGDSQLRASPLMKDISPSTGEVMLASTLAEQLCVTDHAELLMINDHVAPVVEAGEHVHGGTGLLKAQAICPAWAFYQYRLGAKALKAPSSGLDQLARGALVHDVLEQFWQPNHQHRHFADLRDMSAQDMSTAIDEAVSNALRDFSESTKVSANVIALEHERLVKLISEWLMYEKTRGVGFTIIACEDEKKVSIRGIEVKLKIDRIHALDNGGWEFVDYKTGQTPKMANWAETRITEPQLPIYATFYAEDASNIAGVQFGMVKVAEPAWVGLSKENFETESDKRTPAFIRKFTDWEALLTHWKNSIETIAEEIKQGEAAIRFNDEKDLDYCEVKPILRLPERQLQFERLQALEYQGAKR